MTAFILFAGAGVDVQQRMLQACWRTAGVFEIFERPVVLPENASSICNEENVSPLRALSLE